ncbi:MAG: peptidoglycan-binding domain-containing protein [Minisyncoccia bacterium]
MKKIIVFTLFSLTFGFLFASTVLADLIPPNSHPLGRCVKIVNLDEFSDIYLLGFITGPGVSGHETYIIKKDECLSMGYKFNNLKILAAKKTYIDQVEINNFNPFKKVLKSGVILREKNNCYYDPSDKYSPCSDSIDFWYIDELSDKNVFVYDENIKSSGGYVDIGNPLIEETIEYSIAGYSNGKLNLYKSKQTSKYNNNTPIKIETFSNPISVPSTKSTCLSLQSDHRYGSKNSEISSIQDFLRTNNYLNSESTSFFGILTLGAIKKFQLANKISPTGFVGPITRAKIKSLTCNQ